MRKYYTYTVKKLITVQHLVTIEYLQSLTNFSYPEEIHDFYEFVFIEQGKLLCTIDEQTTTLEENNIFLIPANTKHYYSTAPKTSATALIVCFKCHSTLINILSKKTIQVEQTKPILNAILQEAKQTFKFPFEKKLILKENAKLGSQQLIENYIETLLIKLIQTQTYNTHEIQIVQNNTEVKKSIVEEVKKLIESNLYGKITLSQISKQTYYSKTYLNEIFKEQTGQTIMSFSQRLKIQEGKKLLKKGRSISEIADSLCFESPHYFSKVFKKHTGMTPSEFVKKL